MANIYTSEMNHQAKQENTVEALLVVKHIFDQHGITFWLDVGTLLGAVAIKKMWAWDTDVDLGIWFKDLDKVVHALSTFKNEGFNVILSPKRGLSIISPSNLFFPINVDWFRERNDCVWKVNHGRRRFQLNKLLVAMLEYCLNLANFRAYAKETMETKLKTFFASFPKEFRQFISNLSWKLLLKLQCFVPHVFPKHHFTSLKTILFYRQHFNIPSDVDNFLTYCYGDWKTPKKEWCYYKQAGAQRYDLLDLCREA